MKTHTPGPWRIEEREAVDGFADVHVRFPGCDYSANPRQKAIDPFTICQINMAYFGAHDAEGMANARLIAAAPELLAALEGLLKQATGPAMVYGDGRGRDGKKTGLSHWEFNELRDSRIRRASAAIAKAKGDK